MILFGHEEFRDWFNIDIFFIAIHRFRNALLLSIEIHDSRTVLSLIGIRRMLAAPEFQNRFVRDHDRIVLDQQGFGIVLYVLVAVVSSE